MTKRFTYTVSGKSPETTSKTRWGVKPRVPTGPALVPPTNQIQLTMHTTFDKTILCRGYAIQAASVMDNVFGKFSGLMRQSPNFNEGMEKILVYMEQVVYMTYGLVTSTTNADRVRLLGAYLLSKSTKSVSARALDFLTENLPDLFNTGYRAQAGDLRDLLDNWDRANESHMATKLRAVASYCMAFSILENFGFSSTFAEIMYAEFRVQKETKKVTSFIYSILDVIEFVLSRASICWEEKSLGPLFHSSSTYLDWYSRVDEVRHLSRTRGAPDDMEGLRDLEYFRLLEDCIDRGESMVKFTKTTAERKAMQTIINELKVLKHNGGIEAAISRPREEPLAILVPGDPGVGKSTITTMLGQIYANVRGMKFTPECRFDRNPFDDFMSGFKSSMWFMVLDDVACLEPNKCPSGDRSLADVIQLINTAPYTSNQAELEKKGKVPVLIKLLVANTNVLNMNVFHYFSHPSAVQRRFKMVLTPYVKPDFCRTDASGNRINMLDGDKAGNWYQHQKNRYGHEVMHDYWDFEIMQWLPTPIGGVKQLATNYYPFGLDEQQKPKRVDLKTFVSFYTELITKHIENQMRMLRTLNNIDTINVCCQCKTLSQHCEYREAHKEKNEELCSDCANKNCYNKHQCGMCKHDVFKFRCVECRRMCAHNIHPSVCMQNHGFDSDLFYSLQSQEMCQCGQSDCLWKEYPQAIGGVCEKCHYCMSEEDIMEGSCTVCMAKEQYVQEYHPQSDDVGVMGWFTLYILAFLMQLRRLTQQGVYAICPSEVAATQHRLMGYRRAGLSIANIAESVDATFANMYEECARIKAAVASAGEAAGNYLMTRKHVIGIVALLVLIRKMKKMAGSEIFVSLQSQPKIPSPKEEKKDPWKNDNYHLTPVDVGRFSPNWQSWKRQEIVDRLGNNLFIAEIATATSRRRTRIFGIADRYYLVNIHAFNGHSEGTISITTSAADVALRALDCPFTADQLTEISPDTYIMFIPQLPPRKNVVHMFARASYMAKTHGFYLQRDSEGVPGIFPISNARPCLFMNKQLNGGNAYRCYESTGEVPTEDGFCGSPLIGESALGPILIGIHSAGNAARSCISTVVTLESLEQFFANKIVVDASPIDLTGGAQDYQLQDLNEKSCFRYQQSRVSVDLKGSTNAPRSNMKSRVIPTIACDYLVEEEGYEETHGAPMLSGYKPIHIAVAPMVDPSFPLPYGIVKEAVTDYFSSVEERLPHSEYEILMKLDVDTVINGADGIRGIDKINMNTSAGFPYRKSKKELFVESNGKWLMSEKLWNAYKKGIAVYKKGARNNFIFTAALKDEPRPFDKILEGKTRVFTGQNVTHLIIGRQYYLSFIRLMQRNNIAFENAVGCNAHSDDWDKIAHYLVDFAENYFDGDYKNYDKSMMSMVIMEIFDQIIDFHRRHSHMDDEDFLIMRGVAYDIAFAYVDFFGDIASFLRNNPSGHLLTVIINSICGSTYLRIGYTKATGMPMCSFRKNVHPITYGDDVIVAVRAECRTFNFETYRAAMAQYAIVFTPASKTGDSYEFKSMADLDFLKRVFSFDDRLNRYTSPLNVNSIQKSLLTCVASKSITREEQFVATLSSAHREAWQHGEQYFQDFDALCKRLITRFKLQAYVTKSTFLTSENLQKYYAGETTGVSTSPRILGDDSYTIQSSSVSTLPKSDHRSDVSYCLYLDSAEEEENGTSLKICQGVPQNPFSWKVWLITICTTLAVAMIASCSEHSSIAQQNTKDFETSQIGKQNENNHTVQVTMDNDTTGNLISDMMPSWDHQKHMSPYDETLNLFLSRPVEIEKGTVGNGTPLDKGYDFFDLWCKTTPVKSKLANYGFIRGKFHVRYQFDATSFIYGAFLVNIAPGEAKSGTSSEYVSYHSQKQCALVDLAMNTDVELSADLLMPYEWQSLTDRTTAMSGHILEIASPSSASGSSTARLSYRIYCWMSNVELRGATTYIVQSKDVTVHSKTNFSKADRATANLGLRDPLLGMGRFLPTMPTLLEYLQCDPIVDIFTWDQTKGTDTLLKGYKVQPEICQIYPLIGDGVRADTPMSMLSRYFAYWRGSLKFRFKVIKSPFHAGSLLLTWDTTQGTADGALNTNMNKVWNIRESDECEFIVPHDNFTSWFKTLNGDDSLASNTFATTPVTIDNTKVNGTLMVKVFTQLTAPTSTSDLTLVVYLEPGNDFEYAQMTGGFGNSMSSYKLQSETIGTDVYMGEKFTTLRDILGRPVGARVLQKQEHTPGSMQGVGPGYYNFPMFPVEYGYEPSGPWIIEGVIHSNNYYAGNVVRQNLLARIINQFVGVRGSVRWTIASPSQTATMSLGLGNVGDVLTTKILSKFSGSDSTPVRLSQYQLEMTKFECGREIFNPAVNPIHEVEVPYYSNKRYSPTADTSAYPTLSFEMDTMDSLVGFPRLYVSIGKDFDLVRFRGVLPQYKYPNTLPGV